VGFDRITSLAAKLFDVPICIVSLVDLNRQWFKSAVGLAAPETHRNLAFCSYTVLENSPDVFVVLNALEDPRFCNNDLVTGPPNVIFYAGAALIVDGQKLGSLCLIDNKPKTSFSLHQKKVLLDLGALVAKQLSWSRTVSLATLQQRHALLSLTHNINTLSTGLNFQMDQLLEDYASLSASLQSLELKDTCSAHLTHLDAIRVDIFKRIASLLSAVTTLPSLCNSLNETADASAWGPQCNLSEALERLAFICKLAFPKMAVNLDIDCLKNTVHSCFASIFYMFALSAATGSLSADSLGTVSIYLSFLDGCGHKGEGAGTDAEAGAGARGAGVAVPPKQRTGDVIFKLAIPGTASFHKVDNSRWLSFLDTISGAQSAELSSETGMLEYILSVPCRLQDGTGTTRSAAGGLFTLMKSPVTAALGEAVGAPGVLRVLVVDDDSDGCAMLEQILALHCDCSLQTAVNGKLGQLFYAMAEEERSRYDIIFVDLLMPVANGLDMMRGIVTQWGPVPASTIVIAMIGVADQFDQFMQDCNYDPSTCGFSFVITKPFDVDFIRCVVDSVKVGAKPGPVPGICCMQATVDSMACKSSNASGKMSRSSSAILRSLGALSHTSFVKWSVFDKKPNIRKVIPVSTSANRSTDQTNPATF
jgi:CheY-like chemotaxis protein